MESTRNPKNVSRAKSIHQELGLQIHIIYTYIYLVIWKYNIYLLYLYISVLTWYNENVIETLK